MRIEKLTTHIGAELSGVSLAEAISNDDLFGAIREALLAHKVLFLQDQQISKAEHVEFARRFGDLEDHPVAGSDPDHPGLVCIYKDLDSPADHYENSWHCDATWREKPPFGAVLRCVESPAVGGDTVWANMSRAYEDLPDNVKATIEGLFARHSIESSFGARMPIEKRHALKARFN
jgi:taurine dioxygenase